MCVCVYRHTYTADNKVLYVTVKEKQSWIVVKAVTDFIQELLQQTKSYLSMELLSVLNTTKTAGDYSHRTKRGGQWMENREEETSKAGGLLLNLLDRILAEGRMG